jgi:hypothetical protein
VQSFLINFLKLASVLRGADAPMLPGGSAGRTGALTRLLDQYRDASLQPVARQGPHLACNA